MLVHRQGIQTPFGNWAYVYNRKIEQNKLKHNKQKKINNKDKSKKNPHEI